MKDGERRRTLICYDVPDNTRRTRIAKCLLGFGDRVQYSVFVVDCGPGKLQRLKHELTVLMDAGKDSLLLCDLGLTSDVEQKRFTYLGQRRHITDDTMII